MVTHATSESSAASGLRPIRSMRDMIGVTTLIEQVFAEEMDGRGHQSMREMRWIGALLGWMDLFSAPGQGMLPGYVWVEDDRIVGNATVRRLSAFGRGWMIGNVAVAPGWRGRGIARQMMDAALELVRHNAGEWVALQVRTDNAAARGLYQSLGFVDTGELVFFERRQPDRVGAPPLPPIGQLRPARAGDMHNLFTLAQSLVPESVRWAEPVYRSDFDLGLERQLGNWLTGTRHIWRIHEVDEHIWGAALLEVKPRLRWGRLQVWVVPTHTGSAEQQLIDSVLAEVQDPIDLIVARLPGAHIAGRVALTTRGFRQIRALTSMKLTLHDT